ncbi:PIN2/TERF1-interacting telomerase inhibitor 1-like [Antedon mediterranea]|uniref:PIN2/TERF1-interacting telomerase inhibitor 1-like n=1 Tax=Antedon mediterranea TaxID=105859 RepID=UPI003AF701CB
MAMLAEPRRRQKLSSDPRNTAWKNDSDKFGKRMMVKMGWTDGKGLGANEDGCQDHIKVTLKNDTRGLGCSTSHEDKWIAHQDDFNSLLANLNESHASGDTTPKQTSITSLEKKSKKSKKRVHYMKFTKGKDLTGYSSKDMDCIMGRRVSKSEPATPQSQSIQNSEDDDDDAESVTSCPDYGVTTITRTESVQEYFQRKMMLMQKARSTVSNDKNESDQSDDAIQTASFKISQSDEDSADVNVVKKKKKKSKKRKHLDNETNDMSENEREINKEEEKIAKKNLKKKRKEKEMKEKMNEDIPKQKKKKSKKAKHSIE